MKNGDSPHVLAIILFFFYKLQVYIMYARTLYIMLP